MLSKENRIDSETLIGFQKTAKVFSLTRDGVGLAMYYRRGGLEEKRFGVACSKKVCKTSVDRNRIRRVIYSGLEKELPNIKSGFVALFSIKKYVGEERVLQEIVGELLEKADLVSDDK